MAPQRPRVHVIGTGGSISGVGPHRLDYYMYSEAALGRLSIEELLERIPEARDVADITSEDYAALPSTNIGPNEWLDMARRVNQLFRDQPDLAGIVITHGTATLEETAYFLHLTVKSTGPVVITGAMRPPSAVGTDADVNLLNAIYIAAHPQSGGKGVLTALNNQIHSGRDVIKTNTLRVETFRPSEWGFLGYVDSNFEVAFYRAPLRRHTTATEFDVANIRRLPRVDIVTVYGGCDGTMVRAAHGAGARGIVIAGTGTGAIPDAVKEAAVEAARQGVVVVRSTRAYSGRVINTPKNESQGLLASDDLLPQKARILLMLGLAVTTDRRRLQQMFYEY